MLTIEVDGTRIVTELVPKRKLGAAEIVSLLGGPWRVEATVAVDGVVCLVLVLASGYFTRPQNMAVSRICGRMVWGKAIFLVRGEEI